MLEPTSEFWSYFIYQLYLSIFIIICSLWICFDFSSSGGASGIGRATVERLSEEGAIVAIFDTNAEAGGKIAGEFLY